MEIDMVANENTEQDGLMAFPLDRRLRRQNKCFSCFFCTCCLLGTLLFASFFTGAKNSFVGGFHSETSEELQGGVDPQLVQEGTTPLSNPSPAVHSSGTTSPHIQSWLDASVTLGDGIKYEIVEKLHHAKSSFTEGLTYCNGKLYESIGMWRASALLALDPKTGETISSVALPSAVFGEGLTCYGGKFIQLTYKKKIGYIYDSSNLNADPETFSFKTTTGEGWGITYDSDRHELIVSDGSEYLLFWDADTLKEKRKVKVTLLNGDPAKRINELEYWRGRVLANVWFEDFLLVIHPETGAVEKEYGMCNCASNGADAACLSNSLLTNLFHYGADFTGLWNRKARKKAGAEVLNGISVSEEEDVIYMTGKYWDRMFRIRYVLLYQVL